MRNIFVFLFALLLVTSCDDGDIITVELDFNEELNRCEDSNSSYLLYTTKDDPSESLSVLIPRNATTDLFFETAITDSLSTNSNTIRFNYRTYNRNIVGDELCNLVQPADLTIVENFEAADGATIIFSSTIIDDDNDGISSIDEGRGEMDADGNFPNAQDSDSDGIPDYLDQDDDNDNVLTEDEIDETNADGDNNPFTNPLNTDGDEFPDYLDTDDDGDMILTINEDEDQNFDPTNDLANNSEGIMVGHYLNTLEQIDYGTPGFRDDNQYERTVSTSVTVRNFDLAILRQDEVFLGIFVNTFMLPEED